MFVIRSPFVRKPKASEVNCFTVDGAVKWALQLPWHRRLKPGIWSKRGYYIRNVATGPNVVEETTRDPGYLIVKVRYFGSHACHGGAEYLGHCYFMVPKNEGAMFKAASETGGIDQVQWGVAVTWDAETQALTSRHLELNEALGVVEGNDVPDGAPCVVPVL